jgi:hypothetical protein
VHREGRPSGKGFEEVIPKTGILENKSQKKWHVFSHRKPPSKSPQLTSKSPQPHHKKPSRKTHFSQNPHQKQQQKGGLHIGAARPKKSPKLHQILREIPHPQHMKVLQPSLQDIHKPIVSIRIRRTKKKSRLQHKILRITDDPLNHLAIIEINPHPQTLHQRRMFMKMQGSMP